MVVYDKRSWDMFEYSRQNSSWQMSDQRMNYLTIVIYRLVITLEMPITTIGKWKKDARMQRLFDVSNN